ncbi:MAG: hypothetical protein LAP39_05530 [Acidobacteriia bacterium]|nr:hypothetical protein [Terriglobia bacterium]
MDLGHASTAQYQGAKLIDQPFLLLRVVVGEIFLQFLEERALSVGLALGVIGAGGMFGQYTRSRRRAILKLT